MSVLRHHKYAVLTLAAVSASSGLWNAVAGTRGLWTILFAGLLGLAWAGGYLVGRRDRLEGAYRDLDDLAEFMDLIRAVQRSNASRERPQG